MDAMEQFLRNWVVAREIEFNTADAQNVLSRAGYTVEQFPVESMLARMTDILQRIPMSNSWTRCPADDSDDHVPGGGMQSTLAMAAFMHPQPAGWIFRKEPADGARSGGNPNVNTLDKTMRTFVKESLQNSMDARHPEAHAVAVTYKLIRLSGADLREFLDAMHWDDLERRIEAAAVANEIQQFGKEMIPNLEHLRQSISKDELYLMRVDDSGTLGLIGPEVPEQNEQSNYASLVRNNLYSSKESDTAGGSFGLGKAVFWTASQSKTVLFASKLSKPEGELGDMRLTGRAELAWHRTDGGIFEGPGWFGVPSPRHDEEISVSVWHNEALARSLYLDRPDEPGTSVLVVGFQDLKSDDSGIDPDKVLDEISREAALWFWPAMCEGTLSVTVEYLENREVWESRSVDPHDHVAPFIRAVKGRARRLPGDGFGTPLDSDVEEYDVEMRVPQTRKALDRSGGKTVHRARLCVRKPESNESTHEYLRRTAFVRGSGMVIEYRDHSLPGRTPYFAVLLAGQAAGGDAAQEADAFLRAGEGPQHARWHKNDASQAIKSMYAHGAIKYFSDFLGAIEHALKQALAPEVPVSAGGPEVLNRMLRISKPSGERSGKPHVSNLAGGFDNEQGEWVFREIRTTKGDNVRSFKPVAKLINDEEKTGNLVWKSLEPLVGCTESGGRIFINSNARKVVFAGRTDSSSHPPFSSKCPVSVELTHVEWGGDSDE